MISFFLISCTEQKDIFQNEENNSTQSKTSSSSTSQNLDSTTKDIQDSTEITDEQIDTIVEKINENYQKINLRSNLQNKTIALDECSEWWELNAFYDSDKLIKIVGECFTSIQNQTKEFYFLEDNNIFVYTTNSFYNLDEFEKWNFIVDKKEENKYYFSWKQLIKWIDSDWKSVNSSDFWDTQTEILGDLDLYISKLK